MMMTDSRNVKYTWPSTPCLIICIFLWPIYPWLSRQMFLFMLRFNDNTYYSEPIKYRPFLNKQLAEMEKDIEQLRNTPNK